MAEHQYIAKLEANAYVEGVYAIQNAQLGQTKNGKPFLKCLLCDSTGRSPGRMWNISEQIFQSLPTNGFVWMRGQTQPYQGEMQIIVQEIGAVDPSDEDLARLLPTTKYNVDEMFSEVKEILGSLKNKHCKTLAEAYLSDEELMTRFRQAPAAMSLHHAFIGGLLEHTLSLLRLADSALPNYPQVNRDIVLLGLFLHDMGKCEELTWREGLGYSDDGHLVGHIARGVTWLNDKLYACMEAGHPVPKPIAMVIEHIILSHHGQPEFGALKIPATPEAIFVSLIDNVDAKMQMALAATRDEQSGPQQDLGGNFTEKIWALDTRLYRPDPTTLPDE